MTRLIWTRKKPTKVGWYWRRNIIHIEDSEPECIYIRDYASRLAIGNCTISDWDLSQYEWAGPIQPPKDKKKTREG